MKIIHTLKLILLEFNSTRKIKDERKYEESDVELPKNEEETEESIIK